jgi:predicted enzyme related to lactoylglutathione lyase
MNVHEKINYIELPAKDLQATKDFFTEVFNWSFKDYGAEYIAFTDEVLDGGFYKSDLSASTSNASALVIFYSNDLNFTSSKIQTAGGLIVKPIFEFPGGHRFHFSDPSGNEFAVWSDKYV